MSTSSFKTEALETLIKQLKEKLEAEEKQAAIVLEAIGEAAVFCADERLGTFPFNHSLLEDLNTTYQKLIDSCRVIRGKITHYDWALVHANVRKTSKQP